MDINWINTGLSALVIFVVTSLVNVVALGVNFLLFAACVLLIPREEQMPLLSLPSFWLAQRVTRVDQAASKNKLIVLRPNRLVKQRRNYEGNHGHSLRASLHPARGSGLRTTLNSGGEMDQIALIAGRLRLYHVARTNGI